MSAYTLKHVVSLPTKQATRFYSVCFNNYDTVNTAFAVVGGRYVLVARLDSEKSVALNVTQKYFDENEKEDLYCCAWTIDPIFGAPLLAVAGFTAVIKIINTSVGSVTKTLQGHGGEIHEMKVHPRDPSLLFSVSKDLSIRLWNLRTMQAVANFAGEGGHREAPLSIDMHLSGDFFASSGMDHTIKICALLKAVTVHYPIFSTAGVHGNFVDCIRWYGDLLLTRCANDAKILLWKPDVKLEPSDNSNVTTVVVGGPAAVSKRQSNFKIICEFEFIHCDLWFLRFGMSYDCQTLATGNQAGKIYLWDMKDVFDYSDYYVEKKRLENQNNDKTNDDRASSYVSANGSGLRKEPIILSSACDSTIRQVNFSRDKQWIAAVCDNGSFWCWKAGSKGVGSSVINDNSVIHDNSVTHDNSTIQQTAIKLEENLSMFEKLRV
ncbi:1696_t:CDS:10 [Rhizophagus irregularis]|nr:1696_t:CDS:10 [Rhizophagus irregularis]